MLGQCNFDDVSKLENIVEGMTGLMTRSKHKCEICTQGKFTQSRNRQAHAKATTVVALVPIEPEDKGGYNVEYQKHSKRLWTLTGQKCGLMQCKKI